jgi:hypothetical protein
MEKGLLDLHSFLRWVILLLLVITIFQSITGLNKRYTPGQRKTALFLMISCDLTLLVGLYQWFTGPFGLKSIQLNGMSVVMKNAVLRFFAIEHLVGMVIAIILVHIGYAYAKKSVPDPVKQKRTALFFGLALLVILVSIPWPFRAVGAGRGWF